MKINYHGHCSQVGFNLIVYFFVNTGDKLTKNDLNFSCSYCPQNATDCISWATFLKQFPGGLPPAPLEAHALWALDCQALATLLWELTTPKSLENTVYM